MDFFLAAWDWEILKSIVEFVSEKNYWALKSNYLNWEIIIGDTSFSRNVILPIVVLPKHHLTESLSRRKKTSPNIIWWNRHTDELPELHNTEHFSAERYFPETSFHRLLFCRNVMLPNRYLAEKKTSPNITWRNRHTAELPELHNTEHFSAERYFPESSYSRTYFSRIVVQPNHFHEILFVRT